MKRMTSKSIAIFVSCLLLLLSFANTARACPPPSCPGCCYWDGYNCVPGSCSGCKTCQNCNCQDDQGQCTAECDKCDGGACVDDPSQCGGDCHNGCSGGNCVDDQSQCTAECDKCQNGNCVDDQSQCTAECDKCDGGACVDDQSQCTAECDKCDGGACVDDQSQCTAECEICSGGECIQGPDCPNEVTVRNDATGAEPVSLKNGEYYFSSRDLLIRGRGLTVEIVRTYGSRREYNSPFGYGWDMNYNVRVRKFYDPNIITLFDGENRGLEYTLDPNSDPNEYTAPEGVYDFLVENQNGTYTLFKKHGKKLGFNTDGNLSAITDRHSNSITFGYDSSDPNALSTITDDLGREIDFTYDSNGLLSTITDFAGRLWEYSYDSNNLSEVKGPNTVDYPEGLTSIYAYDDANDIHNLTSVTDPNGQTYLTIIYDANDMVVSQTYGDGSYTLSYSPDSNEATVTDRRGFDTKTVYNSAGNPLRESDPCSNTTSYEYNSDMEITRKTFPAGNFIDYTYDVNGNVLSISREPNNGEPNIVTTFMYDPNYYDFVKTIKDPRGNVTTFDYNDKCGGALNFNGEDDYINLDAHIGDFEDLTEGTISFWFKRADASQGGVFISASDVAESGSHLYILMHDDGTYSDQFKIRIAQNDTSRLYWHSGSVTIDDTGWHHFVYSTDSSGNTRYLDGEPVTGTYTVGSSSTNAFFYPVTGQDNLRIGHLETPSGPIAHFNGTIDEAMIFNRALSESEIEALYNGEEINDGFVGYWKMDDNANNYEVVDSSGNNNHGTSSRYTSEMHTEGVVVGGHSMEITYPEVETPAGPNSPVVSFTYNDYGQVETATAPDGIITKFEYYDDSDLNDPNCGRLWKVIVDYNETDSNALNITSEYKYDILGRIIEVNDPNGDVTKFAYNDLDQLTKITAPDPNLVTNLLYNNCKKLSQVERVRADDPNQITSFSYNILDKLKKVSNPLNYVTKYSYDKSENLSDVNDAEENNTKYEYDERDLLWKVTDANGNVTEYSYTANGLLAEVNDANGNITKFDYDGFDRLTCITYPGDTNEVFGYDKNSNITSWKIRDGNTINYEYDALNRLIVKNRPGDPNIVIRYDIAGRVYDVNDGRSVAEGGGITSYKYDRIGRVVEVNDINSRVVKYEYDERGLRKKLTYPDNSYITYEYDAVGRLTKIKNDSSPANVLAEYQYDELSRRTLLTLGNDANAVYEYDIANRLLYLTNNIGDTNIVFDYNDYDKVGNRKRYKIGDANAHVYTYDEIYRLITVDYNDGNTTYYYYDSLGNRTSVTDGSSITYLHNSLNQYTSVGGAGYSYDKNGNMTRDDDLFRYYYDCENRLIDVNDLNGDPVASYAYDYLGRRVRKTVYGSPDVITKYCYDGDQVIAEYDYNDVTTNYELARKFIYGLGIDEPICMIDVAGGNVIYYYHFDGLGSIVALSNENSEIVERYSYDVFGAPNRVSDVNNPYMFTGRRFDPETALYYYRARYYAPDIGRFLQTDPIGYLGGLNLYTYVGNNPLNWLDPWGLHPQDDYKSKFPREGYEEIALGIYAEKGFPKGPYQPQDSYLVGGIKGIGMLVKIGVKRAPAVGEVIFELAIGAAIDVATGISGLGGVLTMPSTIGPEGEWPSHGPGPEGDSSGGGPEGDSSGGGPEGDSSGGSDGVKKGS